MPGFDSSVRLINNTKWRELLRIIGQLWSEFEVAYLPECRFQHAHAVSLDLLGEAGIADPGIAGGPAKYSQIFAVRLPRYLPKRNPVTGVVSRDESLSQAFLERVQALGHLPIEQEPEYLYVYGYGR
jgi:hypothetical protein